MVLEASGPAEGPNTGVTLRQKLLTELGPEDCLPKGLLGGHLNLGGIIPKREQIEHLLVQSKVDFIGFTETWLTNSSPEAAVNLAGYNVFREDRGLGKGRGGYDLCKRWS